MPVPSVTWIALVAAVLVPLLLGRHRERRWILLIVVALLPAAFSQLESLGSSIVTHRRDGVQFRTEPQRLLIGETEYVGEPYDAATDTVTFVLPDRRVVVGPPPFICPLELTSAKAWFGRLAVGCGLVVCGYVIGMGLGRIWPPIGSARPSAS